LRKAHVGAKTYATIEQGQIDQILNAKPRDRRMIIEDAAGISGFKHKRRLAELKLQATEANLLRVNDIVSEVRRQINSLKRQAAKARRYQRLREQLRSKKRLKFAHQARAMDEHVAAVTQSEVSAREKESEVAARLASVEAELTAERQSLEEADNEFRETARRFHQLEAEVDRKNERIQNCRERLGEAQETARRLTAELQSLGERREAAKAELELLDDRARADGDELDRRRAMAEARQREVDAGGSKLDGLRVGLDGLRRDLFDSMNLAADRRNHRRSLDEARERAEAQRVRLDDELETVGLEDLRLAEGETELSVEISAARTEVDRLRAQTEAAEHDLRTARATAAEDAERLASAREREKSVAARLRTLEDIATRFAGVSDGVRMLLTSGPSSGVRSLGVLADFVEAGPQLEGAAEVYLQSILPAVVLEDDSDAVRAAVLLREQGAGRTALISRTQPAGAPAVGISSNGHPTVPEEFRGDPRVLGRLRDHLELKTSANGFVEDRIGDAIVVDNLETALALHRRHPQADYLTPAGDVVYASGVVAAGGAGNAAEHGLLAHTRKTRDARAQLAEAAAEAAGLLERVASRRAEIENLEERPTEWRRALDDAQHRVVEKEVRARQIEDERQRGRRRVEILSEEREGLAVETERLSGELHEAGLQVEEAERAHLGVENRLKESTAEMDAADHGLRALVEQVASIREDLAARRQRHESLATQRQGLCSSLDDMKARIEQARAEARQCEDRSREAAELKSVTEQELADELVLRETRGAEIAQRERAMGERRQRLAEGDDSVRSIRTELEERRQATVAAEVERARAEADRRHVDDLCGQELGITAGEAAAQNEDATQPSGGEPLDVEALDSEIAAILTRIEAIGPVNMTAIEEFSGLEERHQFLTTQRQDLLQSMDSLRETIRRINRSSRERFNEAFEAIRRNYQEIFTALFNGGRADLRLEEGEDVLECGIEIMAQPPGKRLGNVLLMSGGEKAMSAIALLFAIFRYQPSPFCLLDEVDAALDDVNVGRFARMLEEYAKDNQFIIITHNKLSMESADLLYGVTMEEPGVSKLVSLQLN
jgi:chromosome segregation protein